MPLLGIDYGAKKVGLAIAQGQLAVPLRVVRYATKRELGEEIRRACAEHDVRTIVIGTPRDRESVAAFLQWLRGEVQLPVVTEDEQLTTAFAKRLMRGWKGKAEDDAIAAALILQTYVERMESSRKDQ